MELISTAGQPTRRSSTTTHITMQVQAISGTTEIQVEPRGDPIPIATTFRKMTIGQLPRAGLSLLYPMHHPILPISTEIRSSTTLPSEGTRPQLVSTLGMPQEAGRTGR